MALSVEIMAPDSKIITAEANYISAPGIDGMFGILKGHATMLSELGSGEIRLDKTDGTSEKVNVYGGFLKVNRDRVLILADMI
jgi:F-type H+-transporting ATPase subunit epsilon